MLQITHTPTEGTLLTGTTKGDGVYPIIRAQGWRWSRNLGAFYLPRSRDVPAKTATIRRTRVDLEAAGYGVSVDVDDTWRPTAEVEADKIARQEHRVQALAAKADRAHAADDQAWARVEAAHDRFPDNGQPILVGHHSEGPHRRAIARADAAMRASIDATNAAEEADRRAATASHTTGARYSVVTVANRIDGLEAEQRRIRRHLDGHTAGHGVYAQDVPPATGASRDHYLSELARTRDQLDYWTQVRAEQIATGQATNYGPDTVSKGDYVKTRYGWHLVTRANPKTATVRGQFGDGRIPWHEITDHRPAA